MMGDVDQIIDRCVFRECGQHVLARLALMGGPLDEQPLQGAQSRPTGIATGVPHAQRREPPNERLIGAFVLTDGLKRLRRQRQGKCLDAHRLTPIWNHFYNWHRQHHGIQLNVPVSRLATVR